MLANHPFVTMFCFVEALEEFRTHQEKDYHKKDAVPACKTFLEQVDGSIPDVLSRLTRQNEEERKIKREA